MPTTPGSTNLTEAMYERPYAAYHEQSPVAGWFRHIPPTYSGPTLIVYPDTLNMLERAQVDAWLVANDCLKPAILQRCTLRAAIAKITEYVAYYADVSYLAWKDADESSRIAQWRLFLADALLANKSTVPKTGDTAGGGSAEATVPFTQGLNLS